MSSGCLMLSSGCLMVVYCCLAVVEWLSTGVGYGIRVVSLVSNVAELLPSGCLLLSSWCRVVVYCCLVAVYCYLVVV